MDTLTEFKEMGEFARDRDSFAHAQEIVKPFGAIELVLDWCKKELSGDWRWQLIEVSGTHKPGRYIFYFDQAHIAVIFII